MKQLLMLLWLVVFCFSVFAKPIWRVPLAGGHQYKINVTFGGAAEGGQFDEWHTNTNNGYYAIDFGREVDNNGNIINDNPVILSPAEGIITEVGLDPYSGLGYSVKINHGEGYMAEYGHFANPPLVNYGDKVLPGQALGIMGSTGNSTGNHLHWRIKYNNRCHSNTPEANPLPLTKGAYALPKDVAVYKRVVSDNYGLDIAEQFDFSSKISEGWTLGWDVSSPPISGQPGYGADNSSWFVKVNGTNPGIVSPEFIKTLMARSTVMEFSAKVYANVSQDFLQSAKVWVKDQKGSWNNPVPLKLFNYAYNYNNGVFKQNDYNVYYVDFYNVRTPENEAQYEGELQIKQFSIELTKALNNSSEYWAIDWVKIYSKNGDEYVYIASSGSGSSSSSGNSSSGGDNYGSSAPTPPTPPPTPKYEYSGAWTCQGFANGTIPWSRVPVNPKVSFAQGENVSCLVELKNISVNHCVKVDIYKDSTYYWTWGGTYWNNVGGNTWDYSYAEITNSNAVSGNYEFKISIDTGSGFQQIGSKTCTVSSGQPRYIYSGAWVCDTISDGPVQWSKMPVNARTYFNQGSNVSLLVEYKNIFVNHRHKIDIYYNGIYDWTWGDSSWKNVGQWGWGYSYAMPLINNCQKGEYELKVLIDTGAGYQQLDSKTFTVTASGSGYNYSGAWTCDSVVDGSVQWSKVSVNPRTSFVQGNNITCLVVFDNVSVNHRIKVDIYKDGTYNWTWGNGEWNMVTGNWSYSNAIIVNQNAASGQYEFRIFMDVGNGYQLVDSKNCQVDTSGSPFVYFGSWTCDSAVDGAEQYSKIPVNTRTTFIAGQTINCLTIFKNVYVNHRIKVDVYKDSVYSWTWGNGQWNIVNGGWTYSNAIVTNTQVFSGQYEFRIYIDTGSDYQQVDTKIVNVSSN